MTSPDKKKTAKKNGLNARQKVRRTLLLLFLLLFPITFNYYSPALPIMGAFERTLTFSLVFWAAWTLASLFLGRAACGYICPLGGLQEVWDFAADRALIRIRGANFPKYVIGAAWIGFIAYAVAINKGFARFDPLYQTPTGVSWDSWDRVFVYAGMFGLVLLLCAPLGRRAFCHYLCWWAPLNIAGAKLKNLFSLPSLNLGANSEICSHCGVCETNCMMSLPVRDMVAAEKMDATECILCGNCVDHCKTGAVFYRWKRGGRAISTGD